MAEEKITLSSHVVSELNKKGYPGDLLSIMFMFIVLTAAFAIPITISEANKCQNQIVHVELSNGCLSILYADNFNKEICGNYTKHEIKNDDGIILAFNGKYASINMKDDRCKYVIYNRGIFWSCTVIIGIVLLAISAVTVDIICIACKAEVHK